MNPSNYRRSLVGLTMFVRQHGFALVYQAPGWTPPMDGSWCAYHHRDDQFRRKGFPHHVVCVEKDQIIVAQTLPTAPNLNRAGHLSQLALGPRAGDLMVGALLSPLSIRIPMTASEACSSSLPEHDFRAMRILPTEKAAPKTVYILGSEAELRVSASRVRGRLRIYAEIFPSGLHQRFEGEARRMLFPADAKRASVLDSATIVRSRVAGALCELLRFVVRLRDVGLEVETHRQLPGSQIGKVVERDGAACLDVRMPALYDVPPFTVPLIGARPHVEERGAIGA